MEQAFEYLAGPVVQHGAAEELDGLEQRQVHLAGALSLDATDLLFEGGVPVRCECAGGLGMALRARRSPGNGCRKRKDGG